MFLGNTLPVHYMIDLDVGKSKKRVALKNNGPGVFSVTDDDECLRDVIITYLVCFFSLLMRSLCSILVVHIIPVFCCVFCHVYVLCIVLFFSDLLLTFFIQGCFDCFSPIQFKLNFSLPSDPASAHYILDAFTPNETTAEVW